MAVLCEAAQPASADKISPVILAHRDAKRLPVGLTVNEHRRLLKSAGLNADNLEAETCALYVSAKLSVDGIHALAAQGIVVRPDLWVPPVAGRHPEGFHLATVSYDSLDAVRTDARVVRLESVEFQNKPMNDLSAALVNSDDVHNGNGTTAFDGAGVTIAVADSGCDLTHGDIPTPVEAYDLTDGSTVATWGTDVQNHYTPHGTHVTGTVLGRGTLSNGKYKGSAPGANLCFYKIGNDTSGTATDTDMIEALNRAVTVGAKVFTMSYGGFSTYMDGSESVEQAIDAAVAAGVTVFVSAGNEAEDDLHDSISVAPGATSGSFSFTVTNTASRLTSVYTSVQVIWRDDTPGDYNIALACSNLGSKDSLSLNASSASNRGTESRTYQLKASQLSAYGSKNFTLSLQNTASSGTTPLVHCYCVSGDGTFDSPDPSYTVGHPAVADGAIAVGAWVQRRYWTCYQGTSYQFVPSQTVGTLASFSSRGPRVDGVRKPDLVAPGSATISARDSGTGLATTDALMIDNDGLNLDGSGPANYYVMQGTSMACPLAAGVAALVLESDPSLTPDGVRAALTNTASAAASPNDSVGYGLINALAAVNYNPTGLKTLTVVSAYGGAWPGTVTTNGGTALSQWITNSPVAVGSATQRVCTAGAVAGNGYAVASSTNVTLTLTNNATLTWQWQTRYWLAVQTNGSGGVTAADGWYASGSNVVLTADAAPNWHFAGWSGDTNGCVSVGTVITAAMTQARSLAALFEIDRYTVTFDPQGGVVSTTTAVVTNGLPYGALPTPTREGYAFGGWYTDALGSGAEVTAATVVDATSDHTLYAKWRTTPNTVLVTLSDGGTAVVEGGTDDFYTLVLSTQPSADVTVAVHADDQVTVWPTSLTFTVSNWLLAQTVTVGAVNDTLPEGVHTGVVTHAVVSADSNYDGSVVASVAVVITDNDPADLNATWDAGGGADTFIDTPANWDLDANPTFDGTLRVTFGTGGSVATLNADLAVLGLIFNRDADFALTADGGVMTLGGEGVRAVLPSAMSRAYTVAVPTVLAADQNWIVTNSGAGIVTLTVSGSVSDGAAAYGIAKSGDGVLVLAGDNSYDGTTSVAAGGALRITDSHALGSTNGVTVVASNGWVEAEGGIGVPEPLTLGDSRVAGALVSVGGTNVWAGKITQSAPSRIRVLAGSKLTLSGGLSGGSSVYLTPDADAELAVSGGSVNVGAAGKIFANGAGLVALGGTNHVLGTFEVAGLTVRADAPGVLPANTILSLGAAYSPDGTFDLNGFSQTVGQLKRGISTPGTRVVTSATPATLTMSGSTSPTFDGQLTGALSLSKAGTSTFYLTGAGNTFSGVTTVAAGTLDVGSLSSLGGSPAVVVTGGTLRLRNSAAVADAATVRMATGGTLRIDAGAESVGALYLNGVLQAAGTWGATGSEADHINDDYFAGTGTLSVATGELPAVVVAQSDGGTAVAEGGAADSYTVVLKTQPASDVTVLVTCGDRLSASPTTLTFTAQNWNVPQTVTVSAVDDAAVEGTTVVLITHAVSSADAAYNGIAVETVEVTVTDNDVFNGTLLYVAAVGK